MSVTGWAHTGHERHAEHWSYGGVHDTSGILDMRDHGRVRRPGHKRYGGVEDMLGVQDVCNVNNMCGACAVCRICDADRHKRQARRLWQQDMASRGRVGYVQHAGGYVRHGSVEELLGVAGYVRTQDMCGDKGMSVIGVRRK